MELALNLAWLMLAVSMIVLWLHFAPQAGRDRRVQFVALALVIIVLLPAISMTDDLMAAQNPAEVDTCLRRDHDWLAGHAVMPVAIAMIVPLFAGLSLRAMPVMVAHALPLPVLHKPALLPIDNRPPPMA